MTGRAFDAWFKVYPTDVVGNLRFRRHSDEIKATYLDVLALAHTNEPYGFLPPLAQASALIGRSEQALRAAVLALVESGFVASPSPDVFVVPQLVRDRQKVLAGVARQAAASGRSERSVGPSGLRAQDSETQKGTSSPRARGRAGGKPAGEHVGGNEATRWWDAEFERTRGAPFSWVRSGKDGKGCPDAIALSRLLGQFPLDEIRTRITRFLESPDLWDARNATPRVFVSKYPTLAVEVRALPKNGVSPEEGRALADLFRAVP